MAEIPNWPLTGWEIALLPDGTILCNLQFVRSPDELAAKAFRGVPLRMSAERATEFAEELLKKAEQSRAGQKPVAQ